VNSFITTTYDAIISQVLNLQTP